MTALALIIIIPLLIILLFFYSRSVNQFNYIEGFGPGYTDKIAPFAGEDYYDTLFDDVTYFPNEIDKETGWTTGVTGFMRCKNNCVGNCVEYGYTGHSYCFPY